MRRLTLAIMLAAFGCSSAPPGGGIKSNNHDGGSMVDAGPPDLTKDNTPFQVNPPISVSKDLHLKITGTGPAGGKVFIDVEKGHSSNADIMGGSFCALVTLNTTGDTTIHLHATDASGNLVDQTYDYTATYKPASTTPPPSNPTDTQPDDYQANVNTATASWCWKHPVGTSALIDDGNMSQGFGWDATLSWGFNQTSAVAVKIAKGIDIDVLEITIPTFQDSIRSVDPTHLTLWGSASDDVKGDANDTCDQNKTRPGTNSSIWYKIPADVYPAANDNDYMILAKNADGDYIDIKDQNLQWLAVTFDDRPSTVVVGEFAVWVTPPESTNHRPPPPAPSGPTCP